MHTRSLVFLAIVDTDESPETTARELRDIVRQFGPKARCRPILRRRVVDTEGEAVPESQRGAA